MKTLKTLFAPFALATAVLATATPALAQPAWRVTPARDAEIRQDIGQLNNAINRAAQRRTISPREAGNLRSQARDIQRMYANYQRGGLSRHEVQNLQSRVNTVRVALRMERRDWDRRPG